MAKPQQTFREELFKRFRSFVLSEREDIFFFFKEDEEESEDNCYYLEVNRFSSTVDLEVKGIDDNDLATIELINDVFATDSVDDYLNNALDCIIGFIKINVLERDVEHGRLIRRHVDQVKNL